MKATVSASAGFGEAELLLDIDAAEHERRRAAGLGVATGHGFGGLDVLMALPHGLPVPLADLTGHQRAYVQRAPAGICTVTAGSVTRHVTWPCRVTVATVRATSPTRTVRETASKFAPFCARRVVITRPLNRLMAPEELLDYGFYGIGVCLQHDSGELETLVEPRPWRPIRGHVPASAAWWFAETAYGRFLEQPSRTPELSPA